MEDKQLKEAIAGLMKDESKRGALAEMITEYVEPDHILTDYIGMLLNTRALKPGDSLIKKVRKGIKVFSFVPGSIPMRSEITVSERMNYVLDNAIVSVNANTLELESGELGTVESIRSEMDAKMRDYYINKIFTALTSIWTIANTPDNYTSVGGSITATALEDGINVINRTTSGVKAIVGTRKALTPVMKFASWSQNGSTLAASDARLEQYLRTGLLGEYLGAPLVVVNQQWNNPEDYTALIPDDKVLIIGEKAGEFITFGPARPQEFTDMRVVPPQWNYSIWTQFGMIIDNAMGLYVLGNLS